MFPNVEKNNNYLIDNEDKKEYVTHRYCSTARKIEEMCGENAKLFKEKIKKRMWGERMDNK